MRRAKSTRLPEPAALPAVNSLVRLSHPAWPGSARTRVEDLAGKTVIVSRPERVGVAPVDAQSGDVLEMSWTTSEALYQLETVLQGATQEELPAWFLEPEGQARRTQRRRAFRLDVQLRAHLATAGELAVADDSEPVVEAVVHDLSEGGMRCTPPEGLPLAPGDAVWLRLELPEHALRLDATVARIAEDGELGLSFHDPDEREAEAIRAFLFGEQIARRSKLAN